MYAAQADIVSLYGENALFVAVRDGEVDAPAVERALASASAEIDAYIAVRYALPLVETPPFLQTICVDIAVYRLALSADVLSEEHRKRYEDALGFLKRVSEGKATLIITPQPDAGDPDTGETAASGPRPIVVGGPERIFSRAQMRGL